MTGLWCGGCYLSSPEQQEVLLDMNMLSETENFELNQTIFILPTRMSVAPPDTNKQQSVWE